MSVPFNQTFPNTRLRRLRQSNWIRNLTAENVLTPADLIWSMVVHDGDAPKIPVDAMPGMNRLNVDEAAKAAKRAQDLGIPAIAIFPHINPDHKDETGKESLNPNGLVPTAIKAMKDAAPDVGIICDVALDPFTSHGHDGTLVDGIIENDSTVEQIAKAAVIQADAGADIISASEMMDGRIGAIRQALNEAGHHQVGILAYTAKYASAFFGPYREAVGTDQMLKGDKRTYFMDPANGDEALMEAELDVHEGADMMMVKPGMPYLDIVHRLKQHTRMPIAVYQVSGEYSMIMAGIEKGFLDADRAIVESLLAFKRAGADAILTYFAPKVAELLNNTESPGSTMPK